MNRKQIAAMWMKRNGTYSYARQAMQSPKSVQFTLKGEQMRTTKVPTRAGISLFKSVTKAETAKSEKVMDVDKAWKMAIKSEKLRAYHRQKKAAVATPMKGFEPKEQPKLEVTQRVNEEAIMRKEMKRQRKLEKKAMKQYEKEMRVAAAPRGVDEKAAMRQAMAERKMMSRREKEAEAIQRRENNKLLAPRTAAMMADARLEQGDIQTVYKDGGKLTRHLRLFNKARRMRGLGPVFFGIKWADLKSLKRRRTNPVNGFDYFEDKPIADYPYTRWPFRNARAAASAARHMLKKRSAVSLYLYRGTKQSPLPGVAGQL